MCLTRSLPKLVTFALFPTCPMSQLTEKWPRNILIYEYFYSLSQQVHVAPEQPRKPNSVLLFDSGALGGLINLAF